jgi:hypothetical protein
MTAQRKKRGRPPFLWHGPDGEKFLRAVLNTWWQRQQQQRPISRSNAITIILQQPEFAHFGDRFAHLGDRKLRRYLERQLLNCAEFWSLCRVHIREIKKPVGGAAPELVEQKLDLVEH